MSESKGLTFVMSNLALALAIWHHCIYFVPNEIVGCDIAGRGARSRAGQITQAEAGAMFRAALNLFRLWGVTDDQAATIELWGRRPVAGRPNANEPGFWAEGPRLV